MGPDQTPLPCADSTSRPRRWRWHLAALAVLTLAALFNAWDWLALDRMPPGDFPGYVAQVQYVRDSLLRHGRVPLWCVECYGGTTNFTGSLKEYLIFPLALAFEPVLATKLSSLILKIAAGWGLFVLAARYLAAPAVGIIAGYALAFGAIANHQIEHLDIGLGSAMIPPLVLASIELLRRGGIGWMVAVGGLAACQLVNNWVHALSVPVMVLALAALRPGLAADADPWRDYRVALRWMRRVAGALGIFLLLAGSQIVWVALDAENHRLVSAADAVAERAVMIERSPFLFVNRDNALAPWLKTHHPPGFDLVAWDGGRRYVGVVCIAVCAVGALAMRGARHAGLRRWAALAGLLFWFQYWLSLGPRTLLWEIGTSLHWTPASLAVVRTCLLFASGSSLLLAAALAIRARRSSDRVHGSPIGLALGSSAALAFPATSLWSACASVFPLLAAHRSPGHFFDVAPVWLYLLFAVALAAIERRVSRRRAATALLAVIAAAIVIDFAPSRREFARGLPMAPLRQMGARLATVAGEDGTLRIGLSMPYFPLSSWLTTQTSAGHAWGWLPWQSGRHWEDLIERALYAESDPRSQGYGPVEPDAVLLRAARVRYLLLLRRGRANLSEPWRLVDQQGQFVLWEQSGTFPIARGYRSYVIVADGSPREQAATVSRALEANVLAVSPTGSLADSGALRTVPAGRAPEPVDATARRSGPERIAVELDAGHEPAIVSVSEGHHPWWRAWVDGEPAPVLRSNLALMAVAVGPGAHRIELRLVRPALVAFADGVTAAAWIALGLGVPIGILVRSRRFDWRR